MAKVPRDLSSGRLKGDGGAWPGTTGLAQVHHLLLEVKKKKYFVYQILHDLTRRFLISQS